MCHHNFKLLKRIHCKHSLPHLTPITPNDFVLTLTHSLSSLSPPLSLSRKLYVDLVLSRSLKIQKPAVDAVTKVVTDLRLEGIVDQLVTGKVTSFLMSPSAVEKRLKNEMLNAENAGKEVSLKGAALQILESLVVTVVFEPEVYARATELALNQLFRGNSVFSQTKTVNSWTIPMVLERTGPSGGVGLQCLVTMEGEDDGVAFTLDDAKPLVIAFHTPDSLKARIGLQAVWSEYRGANTKKQRDAAIARGRRLVASVAVPDGARSILANKWLTDSSHRSMSGRFMSELHGLYESASGSQKDASKKPPIPPKQATPTQKKKKFTFL
jgi:hypothetical protein